MARFLRFAAGSVRFNIWKDRLSALPAVFFRGLTGLFYLLMRARATILL